MPALVANYKMVPLNLAQNVGKSTHYLNPVKGGFLQFLLPAIPGIIGAISSIFRGPQQQQGQGLAEDMRAEQDPIRKQIMMMDYAKQLEGKGLREDMIAERDPTRKQIMMMEYINQLEKQPKEITPMTGSGFFSNIWNGIKGFFSSLFSGPKIADAVNTIAANVPNIVDAIQDPKKKVSDALLNTGKDLLKNVVKPSISQSLISPPPEKTNTTAPTEKKASGLFNVVGKMGRRPRLPEPAEIGNNMTLSAVLNKPLANNFTGSSVSSDINKILGHGIKRKSLKKVSKSILTNIMRGSGIQNF